ncbi:site-2 protease family protein [Patescibacteria group bacterium]
MQEINLIFSLIILVLSIVIHEVSHGYMAYLLGDSTAKLSGRLTLNPFKHLDMMGSFIVPLLTFSLTGFIFGWAKPVPYNPYNLNKTRYDEQLVAFAGPASNFLVAIVFGLLIRFSLLLDLTSFALIDFMSLVVLINIVLGVFNLVPLPPLDGSKIFLPFLYDKFPETRDFFERYWMFFIFFFIFFAWRLITPIVYILFSILTGF